MPKLFQVDTVEEHGDSGYAIVVANTEEEAKERILSEEDSYIYSAYAHEITEIDGYKVVFKKDKKIVMEKINKVR